MSIQSKINDSIGILKKGEQLALSLNPNEGYLVSFSGGKDSQVVMKLAEMSGIRYHAAYSVCGIDSPMNIYFIRENYPDVKFVHPKEKYIQLLRKKGLPTMMKRYCCERTKEWLGKGEVVLDGVRAEESRKRAAYAQIQVFSRRKEHRGKERGRDENWLAETHHECIKGQDRVIVHPILNWTEEDVWTFIKLYNIPVNPSYEKFGRVGCMFCPFASRWQIEEYEKMYPGFRKAIIDALYVYWKRTDDHWLSSPEEYYDWWKSKKTVAKYLADKQKN